MSKEYNLGKVTGPQGPPGPKGDTPSLDGYAKTDTANTFTAEQKFNGGFTALNGNFAFSDTTNIGMEIGRRDGTSGTPYIDFHTDGKTTDYNSRILASGNSLQVTASAGMSLNGHQLLAKNSYQSLTFNVNTDVVSNVSTFAWRIGKIVLVNISLTIKAYSGTNQWIINQVPAGIYQAANSVQYGTAFINKTTPLQLSINPGGTAIWANRDSVSDTWANASLRGQFIYIANDNN